MNTAGESCGVYLAVEANATGLLNSGAVVDVLLTMPLIQRCLSWLSAVWQAWVMASQVTMSCIPITFLGWLTRWNDELVPIRGFDHRTLCDGRSLVVAVMRENTPSKTVAQNIGHINRVSRAVRSILNDHRNASVGLEGEATIGQPISHLSRQTVLARQSYILVLKLQKRNLEGLSGQSPPPSRLGGSSSPQSSILGGSGWL